MAQSSPNTTGMSATPSSDGRVTRRNQSDGCSRTRRQDINLLLDLAHPRSVGLARIESGPGESAWTYRFFVNLLHAPKASNESCNLRPLHGLSMLGSSRAVR
jgi:hypothetical protein